MSDAKPPERSLLPWVWTIGATLRGSAEVLVHHARGTLSPATSDRIVGRWQRRLLQVGDTNVITQGAERYADAAPPVCRPYVVMTNHQSLLDVPAVFSSWPGRLRTVSKIELSRIPVWGEAMRALGIVFVDRSDRAQAIRALDQARKQLATGVSIWIAPEGTRSRSGTLGPLKEGGFHLARSLSVPLVPAWIEGASEVMPKGRWSVQKGGRVFVVYGAPLQTDGEEIESLMLRMRSALLALQQDARALALQECEASEATSTSTSA